MEDFMELFEQIGLDAGYIIIGTVSMSIILFILVIVLFAKCSRLNKKYKQFMNGTDGKSLEEKFKEKFLAIDGLKSSAARAEKEMNEIKESLVDTYQKMGIVKYDAFKEMGGKLSFALALLNDNNSGFIINCMHSSREGCYTYVKEIIKGESFVILADEEKEALDIAMNSKNYME